MAEIEDPEKYFEEGRSDSDNNEQIHDLARQLTSQSVRTIDGQMVNPFLDSSDPTLNPNSEKFDSKAWLRHVMSIESREPEKYPQQISGVAFKNLGAFGYGTTADYKKTVATAPLELFTLAKKLTGLQNKTKIQILQRFNGLVKRGETCVVLGRPGR
jgi:ATP-binding cassette subfamily G (WHITE) protein 2 (PDR)